MYTIMINELRSKLMAFAKPFAATIDHDKLILTNCDSPKECPDGQAFVPALMPQNLGNTRWKQIHQTKFAYYGGEMAQGIASALLCEELAKHGMIGYFGAAGNSLQFVEENIVRLNKNLTEQGLTYGTNLINSPQDSSIENAIVDLYLKHGVARIGAAAYLQMSAPLVKFRLKGLTRLQDGSICAKHHVAAKISRNETAARFLSPPPEDIVRNLLANRDITEEEASLSQFIPVADDITAEADSGGHTDNRAALALFPSIMALKDKMQTQYQYAEIPRVGLGGGIATPASAAAAFAMGADYIDVGSVHQSCVESGTSDVVRDMLSHATQADVANAPAGDMFEMGAKVQVLKWGTMFSQRAKKLGEWYAQYRSLESMPPQAIMQLEKDYFKKSLDEVWAGTVEFFNKRNPTEIEKANADPHHKMALIFRAYLGLSSRWAINGDPTNRANFQIWCGPAMGAFNEWVKGSFLESPGNRHVGIVATNILVGAAYFLRAQYLSSQGISVPQMFTYTPLPEEVLASIL